MKSNFRLKTALSTKKSERLSEDIKEYLYSIKEIYGENGLVNGVLKAAYIRSTKEHSVELSTLKEIFTEAMSYYKEEYDVKSKRLAELIIMLVAENKHKEAEFLGSNYTYYKNYKDIIKDSDLENDYWSLRYSTIFLMWQWYNMLSIGISEENIIAFTKNWINFDTNRSNVYDDSSLGNFSYPEMATSISEYVARDLWYANKNLDDKKRKKILNSLFDTGILNAQDGQNIFVIFSSDGCSCHSVTTYEKRIKSLKTMSSKIKKTKSLLSYIDLREKDCLLNNRFIKALEIFLQEQKTNGYDFCNGYTYTKIRDINISDSLGDNLIFESHKAFRLKIDIDEDCVKFNIRKGSQSGTSIKEDENGNKIRRYYPKGYVDEKVILVYGSDAVFCRGKNGKMRPLTFLDLVSLAYVCPEFKEIIFTILGIASKVQPIYKDIIPVLERAMLEGSNLCIPLVFNELAEHHTFASYFKAKYKNASKLNINFNKHRPETGYLIIKAAKHIKECDLPILINYLDEVDEYTFDGGLRKSKLANETIQDFYYSRFNCKIYGNSWEYDAIEPEDAESYEKERNALVIRDAVDMAIRCKERISLKKTSIKKMEEYHDEISERYYIDSNNMSKCLVPKKSVFLKLRECLPKEFEWIVTRDRLLLEKHMQQNCVIWYDENIKNDVSAIYSYINPVTYKRHTIEFVYDAKNDCYYIRQVFRARNMSADDGVKEYIESLLPDKVSQVA